MLSSFPVFTSLERKHRLMPQFGLLPESVQASYEKAPRVAVSRGTEIPGDFLVLAESIHRKTNMTLHPQDTGLGNAMSISHSAQRFKELLRTKIKTAAGAELLLRKLKAARLTSSGMGRKGAEYTVDEEIAQAAFERREELRQTASSGVQPRRVSFGARSAQDRRKIDDLDRMAIEMFTEQNSNHLRATLEGFLSGSIRDARIQGSKDPEQDAVRHVRRVVNDLIRRGLVDRAVRNRVENQLPAALAEARKAV